MPSYRKFMKEISAWEVLTTTMFRKMPLKLLMDMFVGSIEGAFSRSGLCPRPVPKTEAPEAIATETPIDRRTRLNIVNLS